MRKLAMVVVGAVLATACGGGDKGSSTLSVKAKAVVPAAAATAALELGGGIVVERVTLALRELKLEAAVSAPAPAPAPAASGSGSGGTDDPGVEHPNGDDSGNDADEPRVGPFLVDLSGAALAAGALTQAFDAEVPAGTYRELKLTVGPVALATGAGFAAMAGSSVVISGTVDGVPFTFRSSLTSIQKRETTVVVGDGSSNVTLAVSPARWFVAADGSRLDPTVEAHRAAIEDNLRASIDAFSDDDEDGYDDGPHGGEGPGHG